MGNRGKREFIQVLRLLEALPKEIVTAAVTEAIHLGAIGFDAVKLIALASIERRPARLDLARLSASANDGCEDHLGGRLRGLVRGWQHDAGQRHDAVRHDERNAANAARPSSQAVEAADGAARV